MESHLLANEIQARISKILTKNSQSSFDEFLRKDLSFSFNKVDLTLTYVSNMRDVIRFVNSFRLSYAFIKDEVYFPDFYDLQLIKFKHPEIIIDFFRKRNFFLVAGSRKNFYPIPPQTYSLAMEDQASNPKETRSKIYKYSQEQKMSYKIDNQEMML